MRNKNIFKLFCINVICNGCKAYVEEKKEIDSLMEDV